MIVLIIEINEERTHRGRRWRLRLRLRFGRRRWPPLYQPPAASVPDTLEFSSER
ncbi:MAG: hypothetical protein AB1631_05030 [Acidobacteriota bacterium]